jgi:uncharacterized membrane protein
MEELFKMLASHVALGIEASAALLILAGAVEALYATARRFAPTLHGTLRKKEIWVRFATWLLLALEFELAADVIRSAISPSWTDIGQLASIAAIRTFLNYFLEKDIEAFAASEERAASPRAAALSSV